jgi:hypothetical protein
MQTAVATIAVPRYFCNTPDMTGCGFATLFSQGDSCSTPACLPQITCRCADLLSKLDQQSSQLEAQSSAAQAAEQRAAELAAQLEHAAAQSLSRSVGVNTDAAVAEAQEAARAAEERAMEAEAVALQLQGLLSDQRSEIKSLQSQLQDREQRLSKAVAAAESAQAGLSAARDAAEEAVSLRAALHVVQEQLEGLRAEAAGLRSSLEDATVSIKAGHGVMTVRAVYPHAWTYTTTFLYDQWMFTHSTLIVCEQQSCLPAIRAYLPPATSMQY